MSRLLALLFCLAALPSALAADPSKPSSSVMKQTLYAVVNGQLEAFRGGDFAAAYAFAAPGIREKFPLADFSGMVKAMYPAIAANTGAVFGLTFDDGEHAVVNVRVTGKDDVAQRYRYELERAGEKWVIAGVVPVAGDDEAI